MRRVPLLAMLLVLCALAVPSRAAADEGILLRGSRNAYVDLYVYENTTVDPDALRLRGGHSYVGFFMSPAPANRDTVGALKMPRVGATGASGAELMRLGQSWTLQAGKYRVFLLTDGPAEVFIPIAGQGYRGWKPSHRAAVSLRRADFSVAAGSVTGSKHLPVSLRSRSLVVAAGLASSTSLTAVDQIDVCVTAAEACAVTYEVAARVPAARTWTYGVQLAMPGRYQGMLDVKRVGGVDAGSKIAGAVLVLTLGRQT
jgi:hypothetical protein